MDISSYNKGKCFRIRQEKLLKVTFFNVFLVVCTFVCISLAVYFLTLKYATFSQINHAGTKNRIISLLVERLVI